MKALKLIVGTGLMVASVAAFAQPAPGSGITGTRHDWSAAAGQTILLWQDGKGGTTTYNWGGAAATDPVTGKQLTAKVAIGLCTKCHTPHQAKSTNLLWNHTLQNITYSWDVPATTAGTTYPTFKGDTYKGPTTKCLSCHDGLLASTDGMWFNRQVMSGSKYVCVPSSGGFNCANSGHEVAEGTNMSKSHPVAMPYPVNGASNNYNFVNNGAQIEPTEWVADPMATNKVKLYNDDGAGNIVAGVVAGRTGMECSSCHDVHNGARTKDVMLLTGKLAGGLADGYICTQCHKK